MTKKVFTQWFNLQNNEWVHIISIIQKVTGNGTAAIEQKFLIQHVKNTNFLLARCCLHIDLLKKVSFVQCIFYSNYFIHCIIWTKFLHTLWFWYNVAYVQVRMSDIFFIQCSIVHWLFRQYVFCALIVWAMSLAQDGLITVFLFNDLLVNNCFIN